MKEKRVRGFRLVAVALTLSVLIIASTVHMGTAVLVWEDDDFVDGWQMNEKMHVTDGMLRYTGPTYGRAIHNSSVNVGTWEFDLIEFDENREYVNVMFIANVDRDTIMMVDGDDAYFVSLTRYSGSLKYELYKAFDYPNLEVLDDYTVLDNSNPAVDPVTHHIKVSREPTQGQIDVYVNDSLVMQADGGLPSDDPFGAESVLYYFVSRDVALDNIKVYDEPTPTPTTPTTPTTTPPPPSIPIELLVVGGGAVVAIVVIVIILRRRG